MSDDIVTRLRNFHDQRDSWQTLTEAADEIERLRADRDRWRNHAQEIVLVMIRFWEGTGDGVVLSQNPPWPDYYRIMARHNIAFHGSWNDYDNAVRDE